MDLTCLLLAPVMSGVLMTYAGLGWAVGAILAFNSLAVLPEVALLRVAYSHSPSLRCSPTPTPLASGAALLALP